MKKFDYMEVRTEKEHEELFLNHLHGLVKFWSKAKDRDKIGALEGLVHSILVMIDGESAMLPPYKLEPSISLPDGEEWIDSGIDIAGGLHDSWYKKNKEELDG